MARRRSGRAPEVFRRAYRGRARTLEATILSLLPPPSPSPAECRCRGRRCLGCGGSLHLLRQGDPSDYRTLLTRAFCFVSVSAPPPPVVYLCHGWGQHRLLTVTLICTKDVPNHIIHRLYVSSTSQMDRHRKQIVRNTMELIMGNSRVSTNVLCNGYDEQLRFSDIGESLCTYAWDLLLARIGDPLMVFLLRFSSIFIPLTCKNHHQVTGPPLDTLLQNPKFSCTTSTSTNQQSSCLGDDIHCGRKMKRRRDESEGRPKMDINFSAVQPNIFLGIDESTNSNSHTVIAGKPKKHVRECQRRDMQTDLQLHVQDFRVGRVRVEDSSLVEHMSNPNRCLQTKEPIRPSSCDVTNETSMLRENKLGYGKTFMVESLPSTYTQKMHPEQMVSQYSRDSCGALVSSRSSTFDSHSKSRKRSRLFSWQRRKKRKINNPADVFKNWIFVEDDKDCPRVERQQNSDTIFCHQHLDSAMSNELPFQDFGSSIKQNELHNHSKKMASRCFNCLMLQDQKKNATGNQIKRDYIFYARFSSSTVFPRNHIINRLKPNDSGAFSLMKHILGFPDGSTNTDSPLCTCSNGYSDIKSQCLYHSLLGLLKSLIRNGQRCQNRKLLCRHCLVSPSKWFGMDYNDTASEVVKGRSSLMKMSKKKYTGIQQSSSSMLPESSCIFLNRNEKGKQLHEETYKACDRQFGTIESYSRHQQVVSFIWAVTRSIVPPDLLGDPSTWRALRKNISKFVRLRRFENFSLRQCIHGLKSSHYPFVSKIGRSGCCCNKKSTYESGNGKSTRRIKMAPHNKFFQCWIYWFFSYMVVPIIGTTFYVTERESGRQDVFYYPKPVWRKLVGKAIICLTKQNYSLMDNASFRNILSKRSFGFSKVRFLPKEKTLRLLANLKAPSKVRLLRHEFASRNCIAAREKKAEMYRKSMNTVGKRRLVRYRSVNSSLRELYVILRRIKVENPQLLGSSVFDYNEIYQKLHRFSPEARKGSRMMPPVFIVVADVSKAFDSIDQDVLIGIIKDVIHKDEYLVRRYAQVVCTKNSIKALYDLAPYDHCSNQNDVKNFGAAIQLCSTNRILIDQGRKIRIKQEKLHYLLSEHLKHNVLQLGRNFYLQKVGISQGSLLSSLLCSFYYGHLERSVILPYLEKTHEQPNGGFKNTEMAIIRYMCTTKVTRSEPAGNASHEIEPVKDDVSYFGEPRTTNLAEGKLILSSTRHRCQSDCAAIGCTDRDDSENSSLPSSLLLRLIDDFLFISTSKRQATSFFNRMSRGFRDYNCFMNNEKFGLNFDVEQSSNLVNRIYTGADGISFLPWSGLLLNCRTLEIQADYTRYLGVHIGSTITVKSHAKPGHCLREKLCDYMRPKCHPIFYDSNINSPAVVMLNAYQAFLLCAMKFHCYICSMPAIIRPSSKYLLQIIERSFSYMYKLIRKRMHDLEHGLNARPALPLNKVEVTWIGHSAYIRILKRKQARHKELLSLLRCEFARHGGIDDASSHLKFAVDDSHSSVFWKLKF